MKSKQQTEWLSAFLLTTLVLSGMCLGLYVEKLQGITGLIQQLRVYSFGLMAVFFIVLLLNRKKPSRAITLTIFSFTFSLLLLTSTVYHFEHASSGKPWVPFVGQKLFLFALSVFVAGPYWVNALWMFLFILQTVFLWFGTDHGNTSLFIDAWEPWYTLFFGVTSATLLTFRFYHESALQKLITERSHLQHLEHLTQVFFGIRDLTNTPLQNLKISSELLSHKKVDAAELTKLINNATERLTSLSQVFKCFENTYSWGKRAPMTEAEILASLKELESKS
jgi:hypothetical protein